MPKISSYTQTPATAGVQIPASTAANAAAKVLVGGSQGLAYLGTDGKIPPAITSPQAAGNPAPVIAYFA